VSPDQAFELDRTAVVLRVFACLAFSAIGLFLAAELFNPDVLLSLLPAAIPALAGLFIAYMGLGFCRQLLVGGGLVINADGLEFWQDWDRRRVAWGEVTEFRIITRGLFRAIGFDLADAPMSREQLRSKQIYGVAECIFPYNFLGAAEIVCEILNEQREKFAERSRTQGKR
jgi:hypothetical protein